MYLEKQPSGKLQGKDHKQFSAYCSSVILGYFGDFDRAVVTWQTLISRLKYVDFSYASFLWHEVSGS